MLVGTWVTGVLVGGTGVLVDPTVVDVEVGDGVGELVGPTVVAVACVTELVGVAVDGELGLGDGDDVA